jgi:exosortase
MAATETTSPQTPGEHSQKRFRWFLLPWCAVLILAAYAPVLERLVRQWNDDPDLGHGFFVPLVAAYIIFQQRRELAQLPSGGNWWGVALLAWGGLQLMVATYGAELFLARTAFLITVIGSVLLLRGWPTLKAIRFPLVLLLFMIPIPTVVMNQITFPLQLLASRAAELVLTLIGIPVLREGNILELPSQRLSVAEACSGIRSLLSLSFLALVYAYFFDRKPWMRWVLLAAAVPVAIVANAFRVTMTGILSEYNRSLADGFFHLAEGWVIFMVSLVMLMLVHQFVRRAYQAARPGE